MKSLWGGKKDTELEELKVTSVAAQGLNGDEAAEFEQE